MDIDNNGENRIECCKVVIERCNMMIQEVHGVHLPERGRVHLTRLGKCHCPTHGALIGPSPCNSPHADKERAEK